MMNVNKYQGVDHLSRSCTGITLVCNFGYQYLACKPEHKPDDEWLNLPLMEFWTCKTLAKQFLSNLHQWKNDSDVVGRLFSYLKNDEHSQANYNQQQVAEFIALQLEQRQLLIFPLAHKKALFSNNKLASAANHSAKPVVLESGTKVVKAKVAVASSAQPVPVPVAEPIVNNGPQSLAEAVVLLSKASERIKENDGYIPKYSDDELRDLAASGKVPQDRFIVRFSSAPKNRDTGEVIIPENNEEPVGHLRDTGRHPLWMSTFDQIEYGDSDPKIIADIFGTNYDPNSDYVLYIVDLGEDHLENGSDVFVPTFSNMRDKLKTEFAGELNPELIDKVMTAEYSVKFREHWQTFNAQLAADGLHWSKSFDELEANNFAAKHFRDSSEAEMFKTRHIILSEIGAWEVFTGDGLTERKSQPGKPGALETLEVQHNPASVKDLMAQGKIIELPLAHG